MEIKAYTGGAGRKVHAGGVVASPAVRNGRGVVALCGAYERSGGSWVASETKAPVDCPECRARLLVVATEECVARLTRPEPKAALDAEVWGEMASVVRHSWFR